jgi:ribosomal protein S18 acetylase RimI-like enzyme
MRPIADRRRTSKATTSDFGPGRGFMGLDVDLLGPEHAGAFRALRLEALERHPCAFAAAHDEESGQSAADVAERLAHQAVFGGFFEGALVGVAGFATPVLAKKRHTGLLWGVYVREAARGRGLGRALVARVIEHARDHVVQLHAAVAIGNEAACGLYRDLGFVSYGTEPRGLKVGERYFDQALMVLVLDDAREAESRCFEHREPSRAAARAGS